MVDAGQPIVVLCGVERRASRRKLGRPWDRVACCGEVTAVRSADGGREALSRFCNSGWCERCSAKRLRRVLGRAAKRLSGHGYMITVTPRERCVSVEAVKQFLRAVQSFCRALGRTDRDTVLDGGVWVAEWVPKRRETLSEVECPVCASCYQHPGEGPRVFHAPLRDDSAWCRDGACLVCDGAGFLPAGHLHVHILACAARPFWWGRGRPQDVSTALSEVDRVHGQAGVEWLLGVEGAAARSARGGRHRPEVVTWRQAHARALAAQRAVSERWAHVPGGGGLWALADAYGLGHTDVKQVADLEVDGSHLVRYLGKVVSYVCKGVDKRADAGAFAAWLDGSRRVGTFGSANVTGEADEVDASVTGVVPGKYARPVSSHRRIALRGGGARVQISGEAPCERLVRCVRIESEHPQAGLVEHRGLRWHVAPYTSEAARESLRLDSVNTTKSPEGGRSCPAPPWGADAVGGGGGPPLGAADGGGTGHSGATGERVATLARLAEHDRRVSSYGVLAPLWGGLGAPALGGGPPRVGPGWAAACRLGEGAVVVSVSAEGIPMTWVVEGTFPDCVDALSVMLDTGPVAGLVDGGLGGRATGVL